MGAGVSETGQILAAVPGAGPRQSLHRVDFAGELSVLDAGKFARALVTGIGHAKAFGCGLLLVRRLD